MILAVVGSRDFNDYELLKKHLDNCTTIESIISGGANGADSLARKYAHEHNICIEEIIPNWDLYGSRAGFIRNKVIIDKCDCCIAFWDGVSSGTNNSIKLAKKNKKPLKIVHFGVSYDFGRFWSEI